MVKWTVFTGLNRTMVENCGICGGVFELILRWCFCRVFVVVVGGGGVVVFSWWCFCGGAFVVVFLSWCFCGGVFVVVFLWWCGGVRKADEKGFFKKSIVMKYCNAYYLEFC